jgi:hypothetical protein
MLSVITLSAGLIRRFDRKVNKSDGCWNWCGYKDKRGYGKIRLGSTQATPMVLAHRVAWAIQYGDPGQNVVCHSCDNPTCVNPDHLFIGTIADNNRDMRSKGRHAYGERHGKTKLSIEDVAAIKSAYANKAGSMKTIGSLYGVGAMHVCRIVNGTRWRHPC